MKALLATIVPLAAGAAQAGQVVDIGACPLDTLTFVDPVAGGIFVVDRVGADRHYLCAGSMVAEPAGGECSGPFGDLVLEGKVREPDDAAPRTVFAIWSVEPAAPCCGWRVLNETSAPAVTGQPGFHWLDHAAVPTLATTGFAAITFDDLHREGSAMFSPKSAMRCELK
jgi:hypothetical protein